MSQSDKLLFILGAGASVDSGLKTYRGENGIYTSDVNFEPEQILCPEVLYLDPCGPEKIWSFLRPLYAHIRATQPGPTYTVLREIFEKYPSSMVLTQNIDSFARTICPLENLVELHGSHTYMKCLKCQKVLLTNYDDPKCSCESYCRPDIVLFDESIPKEKIEKVYRYIKHTVKHIIVVGTTLQFLYLRDIISKAKSRGGTVIHINPDDTYASNVRKNEKWIQMSSAEGLKALNL